MTSALSSSPPRSDDRLRPLIDELPERERTILLLRFFGNKTQTQIAEQVGLLAEG
ncbi:sigma factor-like helix-turn-helix DNA-binding protein [Actinomadura physcomitrii]|uniref:sigma factor-like helix-turn-helix DNA-binding protein n=1 Tax=Actinomadura physcomitrii TaxID=2650748 RepID=UPI002E273E46